jgi:hypothetical protein
MQDSMLLAPHGAHAVLVPGYLVPEKLADGFRLLWELPPDPADRTPSMLDAEAARQEGPFLLRDHPHGLTLDALAALSAQVEEPPGDTPTGAAAAPAQPTPEGPKRKTRKGGA